jgi:hypothetical protein
MAVNVFQIGTINGKMMFNSGSDATRKAGAYVSEYPLQPDNLNGQLARYTRIFGMWQNAALTQSSNNTFIGSYGQDNGYNQSTGPSNPLPWRPNGGYFLRGVWFTDNTIPPVTNPVVARDGYYGSFVGGCEQFDYVFDINTLAVDYEPLYGHGTGYTWPELVNQTFPDSGLARQFRDSSNPLSDASLTATNSASAFTRTPYMPPVYHHLYCANFPVGSSTLGSGNTKFFFEERPSLRAAGFNDNNSMIDSGNDVATSYMNGNPASGGPYTTDPLKGASASSPTSNSQEYFQVTGVRKLNSRGLTMHLAKVFDNGWNAFPYRYEEDGITEEPVLPVNVQTQYLWQRGQDFTVTATSVTSNVATFVCVNTLAAGDQVIMNGFQNHSEYNGQVLTVLSTGLSGLQFEANWTASNYSSSPESTSGAVASLNPDIRIRQAATFTINEEYYGLVSDTKCSIWSNKSSMLPLVFFDLADTWSASVRPRIAGVAVSGVNQGIITNVSLTSNVVTITANNNYQNGQNIYIQNLTSATFLNGQTLTVQTATPLQFTASFTHADYASTPDTGECGGYQIYFLSEDGILAIYDFTQLNGAISLVGFNAPTPAHTWECYGAMKLSADGSTLYAIYGTVSPDPRLTTVTGAVAPRVGVISYNIGTQTWQTLGTMSFMPNQARHNGRSLHELIVLRDGRLAVCVEEVSYTNPNVTNILTPSGTPTATVLPNIRWQVGLLDPTGPTWNSAQIDAVTTPDASPNTAYISTIQSAGSNLTITFSPTLTTQFPVGAVLMINMNTQLGGHTELDGQLITVLTSSTSQITATIPSYNSTYGPVSQSGTLTQGIQYGTNTGQTGFNNLKDFWFYMPNAFMHDVATNKLLIQGNWTAGNLWVLDISGTTLGTSNANLTPVPASTLWSYGGGSGWTGSDTFVTNSSNPAYEPVSITHAKDFATNADRTMFYVHKTYTLFGDSPLYQAAPGYTWGAPNTLQLMHLNSMAGVTINSFGKDCWTEGDLGSRFIGNDAAQNWTYPVMTLDNYMHFIRITSGLTSPPQNLPNGNSLYGLCAQSFAWLPTYHKWVGNSASITSIQIAGNVLTVQATNTFSAGDHVTFSGVSNATFLNGMTVTVLSAGLSGAQFAAKLTYPNYGPTANSGTAEVMWKMADNFADAFNNPISIPSANTNVPLPYGLQVQFGPNSSDTWTSQGSKATITNVSISGNTLTVLTTTNNFNPGDKVTLSGLTTATFLNGLTVTLASASTNQFTATVAYYNGGYGPAADTGTANDISIGNSEFFTFNLCWGNTKFARKSRFAWSMFAGQTFLQTDARTVAEQNAVGLYFVDTDQSNVAFTAPTSINPTPQTAPLTTPLTGWNTQVTWPKLDTGNYPYDATALQMVITANNFDPTTNVYTPYTASSPNITSSGDQAGFPNWQAFAGSAQRFWKSNAGNTGSLTIDLGAATLISGYSFRLFYDSSNTVSGAPVTWVLQGSNTSASGPFTTIDSQTGFSAFKRGVAFTASTPGSFRWIQLSITQASGGNTPSLGMLQFYSGSRQSTFNFSDLCFMNFGSQVGGQSSDAPYYLINANMSRGYKFEVSTNGGISYTQITPLWRAHMGYAYTFARQVGITNLRITVQQGYNYSTTPFNAGGGTVFSTAAFGPVYLFDYGSQTTINNARLGSSTAPVATPAAGSFDPQCIGMSVDAMSLSLDGGSTMAFSPSYPTGPVSPFTQTFNTNQYWAVLGWWSMEPVPAPASGVSFFKAHPFYGFLLFQGAGPSGALSTQSGTNLSIEYHWGRRV